MGECSVRLSPSGITDSRLMGGPMCRQLALGANAATKKVSNASIFPSSTPHGGKYENRENRELQEKSEEASFAHKVEKSPKNEAHAKEVEQTDGTREEWNKKRAKNEGPPGGVPNRRGSDA